MKKGKSVSNVNISNASCERLKTKIENLLQNYEQNEFEYKVDKEKQSDVSLIDGKEIHNLISEINLYQEKEADMNGVSDVLISLFPMLDAIIQIGNSLKDISSKKEANRLYTSVESGLCLLTIMSCLSERADRSFMSEDYVQDALTLMKIHIGAYVLPYLAGEGENGRIDGHVISGISQIIEQFNLLLTRTSLNDTLLLQLSTLCLSIVFVDSSSKEVDCINDLAVSGNSCLINIYRIYPNIRQVILQDLFSVILKNDENKPSRASKGKKPVLTSTILILNLIQSNSGIPSNLNSKDQSLQKESEFDNDIFERSSQGLKNAISACKTILGYYMGKCTKKDGEEDYRPLLNRLIDDLLYVTGDPEYPAAIQLLKMLSNSLAKMLNIKASSEKTSIDSATTIFALTALGRICATLRSYMGVTKQKPLQVLAPSHNGEVDPNPSSLVGETIACLCGNDIVDRNSLMMDCDRCHRWFHGKCVNKTILDVNDVPNSWFCDDCVIVNALETQKKTMNKKAVINAAGYKLLLPGGVNLLESNIDNMINPNKSKLDVFNIDAIASESEEALNTEILYKQLILNYLTARSKNSLEGSARQFVLSLWITASSTSVVSKKRNEDDSGSEPEDEVNVSDEVKKCWINQWGLDIEGLSSFDDDQVLPELSREGTLIAFRKLLCDIKMGKHVDYWLSCVLNAVGQGQGSFRAKAIKALADIVESDITLMDDTNVTNAIRSRFLDEAISVREAAVDFAGRLVSICKENESVFPYLNMITERIRDKGLSVRRRAISILYKVMQNHPEHPLTVKISCALLSRIDDSVEEEDIKKSIRNAFQSLWFDVKIVDDEETSAPSQSSVRKSRLSSAAAARSAIKDDDEDAMDVETSTEAQKKSLIRGKSVLSKRIHHMIEVVSSSDSSAWLEVLLHSLLEPTIANDPSSLNTSNEEISEKVLRKSKKEDKILEQSKLVCSKLVKCALDELVALISEEESDQRSRDMVSIMSILKNFSTAHPPLFHNYIHILSPLTKGNHDGLTSDDDAVVVLCALNCITNALFSLDSDLPSKVTNTLENDLRNLIYKYHKPEVSAAAIECLGTLANKITHNDEIIREILRQFYLFVYKRKDTKSDINLSSASRSLHGMGYLCKWYDFDSEDIINKKYNSFTSRSDHPLLPGKTVNAVHDLYLLYADEKSGFDENLICKALKGLGFLLSRRPSLLIQEDTQALYSSALASSNPKIRYAALDAFLEILTSEERRITSRDAAMQLSRRASTHDQVMGDQDSDAAIFSSVIQDNLKLILQIALDREIVVRKCAAQLIHLVLRQGYVNPAEVVPTMFALSTDSMIETRDESFKSLLHIKEKWPNFLLNNIMSGFKLTHKFLSESSPNPTALTYVVSGVDDDAKSVDCIFSPFYVSLIRESLDTRKKFFGLILNIFDSNKEIEVVDDKMSFLHFLTEILSSLPYINAEEPLHIIYLINRLISQRGDSLLEEMEPIVTELTSNDSEVDDATKIPIFKQQCESGYGLGLLLNVKHYLKKCYTLNDSKCANFTPVTSKANEKPAQRIDNMPKIMLPHVPFPSNTESKSIAFALGTLIPVFETFKKLLNQDPSDFSLATPVTKGKKRGRKSEGCEGDGEGPPSKKKATKSSTKKKTPKSKKKKKKRKRGDDDDDDDDDNDSDFE